MKHFLFIFLFFLIFIPPVLGATPSIPVNFKANISDNVVNISWDASTDADNDTIVYNWVLVNSTGYENITHTVRNESMVLYTHFNDGTSTDWSIYGNNGTDTNIAYVFDEKYGYVVDFDGVTSKIIIQHDETLSITEDLTIEVILHTDNVLNRQCLITKHYYGEYEFLQDYNGWQVYQGKDGNTDYAVTEYGVISADTDYHVIITRKKEGSDYNYIFYVDGESIGEDSTTQETASTDNSVIIGRRLDGNLDFAGNIYLVRIYNSTLSATEVNANSNIIVESASYNNFTGIISNLPYGDYHFIVNARDNSTYSEWSEVYNFSITPPPGEFKATFKIIDQYRSDLVYNAYINGTYITDFNITDAYFINTTNDTSITLTASKNYLDITNLNNVRNFLTGMLGFVLFVAFLYMAFKIGRGR